MLREARSGDSVISGLKQGGGAAGSVERFLGGHGASNDVEIPKLPMGQPIAHSIETQLPPHPRNMTAKDGEWQVVNGTR